MYVSLIRRLRSQGYRVHLFFLWLPSVDLALSRIRGRVVGGGHDVPEAVVRRRFDRSARNFFVYYRSLADSWVLFDSSEGLPAVIAVEKYGQVRIMKTERYEALLKQYGR